MTFDQLIAEILTLLQREKRLSYRALKRRFDLDDDDLEELKEAILHAHPQVVDDHGRGLAWIGAAEVTLEPVPQSTQPALAIQADQAIQVATPSPKRSTPDTDNRLLTVMYCDLVGSTPLAERLDPEDLREVVRAYQQASAMIIARFDGYLAQYQGDALLVYFGYPQVHDDDAQRAVYTGLGIVASLDDLNARIEPEHGVRLAVRIGIHTGPAVVQTLGAHEQLVLGDTPAVAAGMQGLAAPDSVVVSAATARLLHDAFVCEDLGMHIVTGADTPMTVLQVGAARMTPWSESLAAPLSSVDAGADEAERRQLTVMFCDLADTPTLATQLTPDALFAVIQAYQEACAAAVARFDGHIAQYLDHGLLVYFGFPHAHEDDAQRAVRTGLGIVATMPVLNARLTSQYGVRVAARIGIHTGQVVAGAIGGSTRIEQLAVGATPNIAARIHGRAAPDTVTISATTLRLVRGYFVCENLGIHALKGVADPMPMARVLAETTAQSRLEAVETTELSALVGRETELALLADHWAESRAGQGRVVMLWGEAGIGKSRLVEALHTQVNREDGTWLAFRCSPYDTNSALSPIITHLERRLQFTPNEPAAAKVAKLERWLEPYRFPQSETVPLVAALLSVPLPEGRYPPLRLSPQQQRQRTQATLVAWLLEEAERQPVLAVWEDLHWMDPSTLEMLSLLLDHIATARMLSVLTARLEFQPTWEPRDSLTLLTLSRLGRVHVEEIAHSVTRGKKLPAEILAQIVEKADGVPLFIEELTKTIVESGIVRAVNNHYELTEAAAAIEIPLTLQDSLMARLDRLGVAKQVAQVGAVIGREFSPVLLEAVTLHDVGTVQGALDQLVVAELLYPGTSPPSATYLFKHALIQDAAYQSLLRRTRRQYHQRIAQVLADRFPETVETRPEVLAHHYTEAGRGEQAIGYWQRAGERATQRSANMEAVNHLTKGLEILRALPDTPERIQQELMLQVALGAPLMATKGYSAPEVGHAYARAQELCQQIGDTPQLFPVLYGLWVFYAVGTDLQTARELGEQCLRVVQGVQDPGLLLEACAVLGPTLFYLGELAQSRAEMEEAITLYDPQQHRSHAFVYGTDPGVVALGFAARTLCLLGYPEQARQRGDELLALAQELSSHHNSVGAALMHLAVLHLLLWDGRTARIHAEALITRATEQELPLWLGMATMLRGAALVQEGCLSGTQERVEEGIAQVRQGVAAYRATGAGLDHPHCLVLLASGYKERGQIEDGLNTLVEVLAVINNSGERYYEAELHRLKGELLLKQVTPDEPQAEACLHRALDVARHQQAKLLELRATLSLSRLWQHQGKRNEARQLLAKIYGWFTEGFDTVDLREAKALLDELGQ
jgi:predicted ATPase/class 3 adenylate cyclase